MKPLIFDTETSGLRLPRLVPESKQPHIFEFYGCLVDESTWEIVEEFDELMKPPVPLVEKITKITTVTNEMIADKPPFKAYAEAIKALIEKADRVVAHNASFDVDMVNGEMSRLGMAVDWPEVVCTVEQTMHLKSHRLKLSDLHELLFGDSFKGAHRARVDVEALTRCYKQLRIDGEI